MLLSSFSIDLPGVAVKPITFVVIEDKITLPETLEENSFIIGNFQKIYSGIENKPKSYQSIQNKLDLIIVDEAHKAIAPTYKKVIDTLSSITTKVIGLTATPGRSIVNEESNKSLSNFFHNKIITIPLSQKV